MEMVKKITTAEFKELIKDDSRLLVVDLFADWCGPCRVSSPQFEKLSKKYNEKEALFVKVDVDVEVAIAQSFNVRSIPAFFILRVNKILASTVGANVKKVESDLNQLLKEGKKQAAEIVTGYH